MIFKNQYNGGYNSFSPYMNSYNQQQYVSQQVVKVNGENGANAYQMAPNSSALLLDEKDPLVYLVQTDGAGYYCDDYGTEEWVYPAGNTVDVPGYSVTAYTRNLIDEVRNMREIIDAKTAVKADKVRNAVNGHLAGLDSNGNLTDSGKSASDFAPAEVLSASVHDWIPSKMPRVNSWNSVAYGNGKFVVVAGQFEKFSDKSAYSTDGINWTESTLPSSSCWNSIAYGNGKFVVVSGDSGKAAYSTDGINWTASTMPYQTGWNNMIYGGNKFVAVGSVGDRSYEAAYSTDGINWSAGELPDGYNWMSVAYGNNKYVAVRYNYNVGAYSTNGATWDFMSMPSQAYWQSVTFGAGKFVAVESGYDISTPESYGNKAAYSTDGINWTEVMLPGVFYRQSIEYVDGKFIVVGINNTRDNDIYNYSTDGITWYEGRLPYKNNWQDVAYGGDSLVAISNQSNKVICKSSTILGDYINYKILGTDGNTDTLWENADTEAAFSSQSIYVNLASYSFIVVEFLSQKYNTYSHYYSFIKQPSGTIGYSSDLIALYNSKMCSRQCGVGSYYVTFSSAKIYNTYGTATTNNDVCIPFKIYGIH